MGHHTPGAKGTVEGAIFVVAKNQQGIRLSAGPHHYNFAVGLHRHRIYSAQQN